MIKVTSVLALAALALGLSTASFAANKTYGVTNDDNPSTGANTATVFTYGPGGTVVVFKTLKAGGSGLGGGYFAAPRNAIEQNASCVFVANVASSSIAAFAKATGFAAAPGSPFAAAGSDNSDYEGMGLSASADGKYLYVAYSGSDSLGSYSIAASCALTPISSNVAAGDAVSPLEINSAGTALVVSELNNQYLDSYAVAAGAIGTQTSHQSTSSCGYPGGVDITEGGSVVTGEATLSQTYCTAKLTGSTLSAVAGNTVSTTCSGIGNIESPVFNKAAYTGASGGLVFLGASGYGGGGSFYDAGFTINPVSTGGVITATANTCVDAYTGNTSYLYGTNPGVSTVGSDTAVWQSYATSSVTNIVTLYKVVGNTITKYGSVSDPNANGTSYVLSISSYPGR